MPLKINKEELRWNHHGCLTALQWRLNFSQKPKDDFHLLNEGWTHIRPLNVIYYHNAFGINCWWNSQWKRKFRWNFTLPGTRTRIQHILYAAVRSWNERYLHLSKHTSFFSYKLSKFFPDTTDDSISDALIWNLIQFFKYAHIAEQPHSAPLRPKPPHTFTQEMFAI